jgi:hypothetical protein
VEKNAKIGIHLLGAFGFALLILLISSISRHSLNTFFVNGVILAIPLVMYELIQVEWLRTIMTFSFIYIMKVQSLFDHFKTVNVFGYPVLYPISAVILMIVVSLTFIMITFQSMKHKEVT